MRDAWRVMRGALRNRGREGSTAACHPERREGSTATCHPERSSLPSRSA